MKPLTVSEIANQIRDLVKGHEAFSDVSIIGEITDYRGPKRHLYFSVKDEKSVLRCVMWHGRLDRIADLKLENGMKVVLTGDITTYPGGSNYQLDVQEIRPMGTGDLFKQFIELKEKLAKEGLFDTEVKLPIPRFVRSVGIISSLKGAGFRDMMSILESGPPVDILLYDSRVQGEGASQNIIEGLKNLDGMVDIILFGRGGGSMEDLWCFNDEKLAYAVFNCKTPTISAVGHDIDQVITDLVADKFTVTPTAAAELVVNNLKDVIQEKDELTERLATSIMLTMRNARQTLDLYDIEVIGRAIKNRIQTEKEALLRYHDNIDHNLNHRIMVGRSVLGEQREELRSSWVAGIKEKGLVAFSQDGSMVHDTKTLKKGKFEATFKDGKAKGEVIEVEVREDD